MKILLNIVLIFSLLIIFVPVFRRFIFHLLVGRQLVKEQRRQYEAEQRRAKQGGIRVDHVPNDPKQSRFKGGDYVDYEDVK